MAPFELVIKTFQRFFPAGETESGGQRKEPLVRLVTEPGGVRTLALSSIRSVK